MREINPAIMPKYEATSLEAAQQTSSIIAEDRLDIVGGKIRLGYGSISFEVTATDDETSVFFLRKSRTFFDLGYEKSYLTLAYTVFATRANSQG